MEAAGNDYLEIVELLLEKGAEQNLQDQVCICMCICMLLCFLLA